MEVLLVGTLRPPGSTTWKDLSCIHFVYFVIVQISSISLARTTCAARLETRCRYIIGDHLHYTRSDISLIKNIKNKGTSTSLTL